jgi:hypothetical protein
MSREIKLIAPTRFMWFGDDLCYTVDLNPDGAFTLDRHQRGRYDIGGNERHTDQTCLTAEEFADLICDIELRLFGES